MACMSSTTRSLKWGVDAVFSSPLDHAAVDDVDLGPGAALEILEHRGFGRPCVAHRYFERFVGPLLIRRTAHDQRLGRDAKDFVERDPCAIPTS